MAHDTGDPARKIAYYHRQRTEIIIALGGQCAECGSVDALEIHHLYGHDLPAGRPSAARIRDWKDGVEKGDLALLCPECHKRITYSQ